MSPGTEKIRLPKSTGSKAGKTRSGSIEVKELLHLLRVDPRAQRSVAVILALKELGEELSYPVTNYDELVKKMGGKKLAINKMIDKGKLRSFVPKYYFPVSSQKEFMEKVSDLYRLRFSAAISAPTLPLPPPREDDSPTIPLPPPRAVAFATRRMSSPLRRSTV